MTINAEITSVNITLPTSSIKSAEITNVIITLPEIIAEEVKAEITSVDITLPPISLIHSAEITSVEITFPSWIPEVTCQLILTPQLRIIAEREAPETLIEPRRESFRTEESYLIALAKFNKCGHWATWTLENLERIKKEIAEMGITEGINAEITEVEITLPAVSVIHSAEIISVEVKEILEAEIELPWIERMFNKGREFAPKLIFPYMIPIITMYEELTGEKITEENWYQKLMNITDFIMDFDVLSKLFFGKNLKGEPEEFGGVLDYIALAGIVLAVAPIGKVAGVGAKVFAKAGPKGMLGVKTALKSKGASKSVIEAFEFGARFDYEKFKLIKGVAKFDYILNLKNVDDIVKALYYTRGTLFAEASPETLKALGKILGKDGIGKLIQSNSYMGLKVSKAVSPEIFSSSIKGVVGEANYGKVAKFKGFKEADKAFSEALEKLSTMDKLKLTWKNYKMQFIKNPLMGVFSTTEYAALFVMSIFAFKWLAEKRGKTPTGISISLSSLTKRFDNLGYEFREAVDNKNWGEAQRILTQMQNLALEFNNIVKNKKDVLKKTGEYEAQLAIGEALDITIESGKAEIGEEVETLITGFPESIIVNVRQVYDGDTIAGRWVEGDKTLDIRTVGMNSPETGEKGKKESKDWFASQIWGKDVEVKIDPDNQTGGYGRVLGTLFYGGENINLKSLRAGWSHYYPYVDQAYLNKYIDDEEYRSAEKEAQDNLRGIWGMLAEVEEELGVDYGQINVSSKPTHAKIFLNDENTNLRTAETIKKVKAGTHKITLKLEGYDDYSEDVEIKKDEKFEVYKILNESGGLGGGGLGGIVTPEEKILFSINSTPDNAKVFIDGIATNHNTPTDEVEQKDKIDLWTEGTHTIKVTKSGMEKEKDIVLVKGIRLTETIDLTSMIIPPPTPPTQPPLVDPMDIPTTYTPEQEYALIEAFTQIWNLTGGSAIMSEAERNDLIASFSMYSPEQKLVLDLLWQDLTHYTWGSDQLSDTEFYSLKTKYHIT